jgi:hypothetical protein
MDSSLPNYYYSKSIYKLFMYYYKIAMHFKSPPFGVNNYSKIIIHTKWGTLEKPFSWNSKIIWLKTHYNPQGCRKHWSIIIFMDILTCKYPSKVYPCIYSEVINECYVKVTSASNKFDLERSTNFVVNYV